MTEADRLRRGDPRQSLEERYPTRADYVAKVRAAALGLQQQGFMLDEDVERMVQRAETTSLLPY